ncbi:hypothetical protein Pla110_13600 [Polystyrenella longa]|uniref:Uncharacterized protein n=1 Tax=Polystyrenella longa TaxID=2528007 RepID=A0A518CK96_9PLAN|nr:hypothetical protein [Polystyrenella longa]QDU79649.1 hypothetical protein Pla110_13600 [Polystyrenella longa]
MLFKSNSLIGSLIHSTAVLTFVLLTFSPALMLGKESRSKCELERNKLATEEARQDKPKVLIRPWGIYIGMPVDDFQKAFPKNFEPMVVFNSISEHWLFEIKHEDDVYKLEVGFTTPKNTSKVAMIRKVAMIKIELVGE